MKQRRAAAPYAKALFALAKEGNQTELIGRELGDEAATFESVADLRDFFARPWIPATAKRTVATEVAQRSGLSRLTTDFLASWPDAVGTSYAPPTSDVAGRIA